MWLVKSACGSGWDGSGVPAGAGGICQECPWDWSRVTARVDWIGQVCVQESVGLFVRVGGDTWLNPFFSCTNSTSDNYEFLKGIKQLVQKSGHKIKICHEYMNRGDRWMQVCTNELSMSLISELILKNAFKFVSLNCKRFDKYKQDTWFCYIC